MTNAPLTHDEVRALMPEQLRGQLDDATQSRFQTHLSACASCTAEFEELCVGWGLLDRLLDVHPPQSLRTRTMALLAAYVQGERSGARTPSLDAIDRLLGLLWPRRPVWQAGIAVLLLAGGWLFGSRTAATTVETEELARLRGEVSAMSRMLAVSLLQQQSASDRLKGVSMTARLERTDDEVTAALLDALKYDANVNVRLAALDALGEMASRSDVRSEMIAWLPKQSSPLVQLAMVDLLAEHRDASIDRAFTHLMNTASLNPTVRERVQMAVGDRP